MAESRKVVTIVFSDVTGSTALGEQLDPEAMRSIMERYFAEMRSVLEGHGGTVEKFIGDAVMAVFGIPTVHEDDALRGVRAAAQMRERLDLLNVELTRERGVALAVRTGVNTGEVVAGDPSQGQAFATGDAVNVAARLEQAAEPGEILVGPITHELVREAVRAEAVAALELKGKSAPVQAWRLVEVLPDVPAYTRRIDAPFVGREIELTALRAAYERSRQSGSCELVTVTGAPGIGKSRLVRELVGSVEREARVVVGRCLAYGEGITYWPLAEIVRQVAGSDPRDGLKEILGRDADGLLATERLLGAIGTSEEAARTEEIFWATRILLERLALERPLVAVIDDLHWAEPTLCDLIEYVVGFARRPILVACTARPELFDSRPQWPRASIVELEALDDEDAETLIESLVVKRKLPARTRETITAKAEGNPLFVEQMLALTADNGAEDPAVPATIQALLTARLDNLPSRERGILVRGAVEGRLFHRGAVSALLSEAERDEVPGRLLTLVRKAFIRPDDSLFTGDDAFRFVHVLVRDAAYDAAPKALRADLHERFAGWLEERAPELEEIVGYHLEQAYRYRQALGHHEDDLARRAGDRLAASGQRAARRGDHGATANLLERATQLLPADDLGRLELALPLGESLAEAGRLDEAESRFAEAAAWAHDLGEEARAMVLDIELMRLRNQTDPSWSADEARALVERALPVLGAADDDAGLARAWRLAANAEWMRGKLEASKSAAQHELVHAEHAGEAQLISDALTGIGAPSWFGLDSISELLPFHERVLAWARGAGHRTTESAMLFVKGRIAYEQAHFEDASELLASAFSILDDLGLTMTRLGFKGQWSWGELQREPEEVERRLRENYQVLKGVGETGFFSTQAADLALVLALRGDLDEAERLSREGEEAGAADDVVTQVSWRRARAAVMARRGNRKEAVELACEAVARAEAAEYADLTAEAHITAAEAQRIAGQIEKAARHLEHALAIYERKEFALSADAVRAELAELQSEIGSPSQ